MKLVNAIFFLFISTQWLLAQDGSPASPWNVNVTGHYGFIISHTEAISDISDFYPWGFQVDIAKHINTQNVWNQCKCYPKIGGSLSYINFGSPEILGNAVNLMAFIEPFITYKYRVNPSFRLGAGVSYLNQVYDPVINPKNLYFSSPISFIIMANLGVNIKVNPQWSLYAGGNFNHISNGRIKQPNKGINFPTFNLGANFYLTQPEFPDRRIEKNIDDIHPKRWKFSLALLSALKELEDNNPRHLVMGMSGNIHRILTRLNAIHTGFEWLSDNSIKERNQRAGEKVGDPSVLAYLLGHELMMGRFSFTQTLGFYFNKPFPDEDKIFHRWGLYYHITDRYFFGINLKVHGQTADFLDLRMGISLN